MTEQTIFQAGSISKPIFALAVMRLAQEHRLDLDQDVSRYLKSWRVPASDTWQPHVTLRHILTHSAGLTVHGFPGYGVDDALPSVVQILNGEPPANTPPVVVNILPGIQTRYSGGGTTVGQLLVTDVIGKPFPTLMRSLVLDPLEMAHSTYEQPLSREWAIAAAAAHPWKGRNGVDHRFLRPGIAEHHHGNRRKDGWISHELPVRDRGQLGVDGHPGRGTAWPICGSGWGRSPWPTTGKAAR